MQFFSKQVIIMDRSSGILMSMSALPSKYGIGSMGKCAYEFVDFLKAAGQKYWQLLPLGPTCTPTICMWCASIRRN